MQTIRPTFTTQAQSLSTGDIVTGLGYSGTKSKRVLTISRGYSKTFVRFAGGDSAYFWHNEQLEVIRSR